LTIAVGIALASLGEGQEFQALGFGLALFSNILSGLRWAMTHKLLKGGGGEGAGGDGVEEEDDKLSPLTATLYTSPATVLSILPIALAVEAKSIWNDSTLTEAAEPFLVAAMLMGIATLVFCVIMSEYWLVNATSSLTLSVAGIFKEMLTIGGGLFFFSEHVDMLNVVGFFVCQIGIGSYVYLRFHKQRSAADAYTHVLSEEDRAAAADCPKDSIIQSNPYTDDGMELTTYDDHESLSHLHQSRSLTENHEDGNTSPGLLT
jgi:solute carrier family 35 protein C2